MKTQNPVSQKIRILHKINKTNIYIYIFKQKCQASEKYVYFYALKTWLGLLLHELLNQCGVAWRQSVCGTAQVLWSPGCFESDLQVIYIVGFGVSHLPLDNTPKILYGVQVRRVCWPIKHSNTMVIEPAFWTFGSVGRCQVLLENEISISIKPVSRRKYEVLYNFLVDGCIDCGLQKSQWTNTSRWHGSPNHHRPCKLHTGLQATWILCLSTLPTDSGTLISKGNTKFTFIWKVDFGLLSNSPVLFLLSPGKMLLTMFLFQKWLGSLFLKMSERLQLQFTPCEDLPSVWIGFAWQYSQACGHSCCLCTFSYPISYFQ